MVMLYAISCYMTILDVINWWIGNIVTYILIKTALFLLQAIELRKCCKCPQLSSLDPRKEVKDLIAYIESELAAERKRKELEAEAPPGKALPAPGQEVTLPPAVGKEVTLPPAAAAAAVASHSAASWRHRLPFVRQGCIEGLMCKVHHCITGVSFFRFGFSTSGA